MTRTRAWALLLLVAGAAGCSRCGGGGSAASAEELLPAGPALAASSGTLGALAQHGAALSDRASAVPGGEVLDDYRKQLAQQLGFDPLTREGLLSAGLDPDRGAALAASLPEGPQGRPAWIIAAPLSKPDQFAKTMDQLLGQRAGYPLRAEEPREGVKIVVFARSATPGPRVAYAIVKGYGLLARGADPAAEIAAAATRKREQSLAGAAPFAEARKAPSPDLLIFAPAGSALGERIVDRTLEGDTSLALSFAATGIAARVHGALPAESRERLAKLLPGGGGALMPLLPATAPLQARLGISPAQVAPQLERLPLLRDALQALRKEVSAKGVDLDQDLFGALQPGIAFAAASSPALELYRVVDMGFLDWRSRSPFDFAQVLALAQVQVAPGKKERLLLALDAVAQAMPRVGAQAARTGDSWQVRYAGGAGVQFGLRAIGNHTVAYVAGGGVDPGKLEPRAAAAASDQGVQVSLDLGKLSAALRALPESTYGSGPQSFLARSLVDRIIEPFKLLRASFALAPSADGLDAWAQLDIAADPAAARPKP